MKLRIVTFTMLTLVCINSTNIHSTTNINFQISNTSYAEDDDVFNNFSKTSKEIPDPKPKEKPTPKPRQKEKPKPTPKPKETPKETPKEKPTPKSKETPNKTKIKDVINITTNKLKNINLPQIPMEIKGHTTAHKMVNEILKEADDTFLITETRLYKNRQRMHNNQNMLNKQKDKIKGNEDIFNIKTNINSKEISDNLKILDSNNENNTNTNHLVSELTNSTKVEKIMQNINSNNMITPTARLKWWEMKQSINSTYYSHSSLDQRINVVRENMNNFKNTIPMINHVEDRENLQKIYDNYANELDKDLNELIGNILEDVTNKTTKVRIASDTYNSYMYQDYTTGNFKFIKGKEPKFTYSRIDNQKIYLIELIDLLKFINVSNISLEEYQERFLKITGEPLIKVNKDITITEEDILYAKIHRTSITLLILGALMIIFIIPNGNDESFKTKMYDKIADKFKERKERKERQYTIKDIYYWRRNRQ